MLNLLTNQDHRNYPEAQDKDCWCSIFQVMYNCDTKIVIQLSFEQAPGTKYEPGWLFELPAP